MAHPESTRVLIIGSGVAGSLVAEELLALGLGPVTMLEAGQPVPMRDYRAWLDRVMAGKSPFADLTDRGDDYTASGSQAWLIEGGRLLTRGGSTIHWGGWCPRMKPEDFELASRTGGGGLDWPISYDDLQPYYEQAEFYLQVAGDSADQDPARRSPYPFEAPTYTLTDGRLIAALDSLGISHMHIPVARNARSINGQPGCVTTGTCDYCPIGARFTGDQPLDRLVSRYSPAQFTLRLGAAARRIRVGARREAVAVEYVETASGRTKTIEAEQIILCAGSFETPKLLLASASPRWPRGIGNDTDQVGRYLIANPYFFALGTAPTNPLKLQEELFFPTLGSRHWDTPAEQREGKFFLNRPPDPNLNLAELMGQRLSATEIAAATTGAQTFQLQGTIQTFSRFENRVSLAAGQTRFGLPRTRIDTPIAGYTASQVQTVVDRMNSILVAMGYAPIDHGAGVYPQRGDHAMCTCRMSESPADGVVDPSYRVHGMDNLYVVSNAIFPSGAAANPTLTLAALAFRFIDQRKSAEVSTASLATAFS